MNKKTKIIALSGLGGSGKTTYIKEITSNLQSNNFEYVIIPMREYFLWPRMSIFFRKLLGYNNSNISQEKNTENAITKKNIILTFIRTLFYLFDFWRVYCIGLLKARGKIVIFDRFFHDFIVELSIDSGKNHEWMLRILPKPTVNFYCQASAQVVFNRKKEAPLETIKNQEYFYEHIFMGKDVFVIDSTKEINLIVEKINSFILEYVLSSNRNISFLGFTFFSMIKDKSLKYFEDGVFVIDQERLLKQASYNRITWFCARCLLESRISFGNYNAQKINTIACESYKVFEETIEILRQKYVEFDKDFILAKNDFFQVELSGDVDIVTFNSTAFKKIKDLFENQKNVNIVSQSEKKFDISIENKKPIDVHLGFEFGNISYIEKKDIEIKNPESIKLASNIGHLLSELSMLNWGDFCKIQYLAEYKNEALEIASNALWKYEMQHILEYYENIQQYGFQMPYFISAHILIRYRIKMFLKGKISLTCLMQEIIFVLKQIRARHLGFIPFHDEWYYF